ncbi:hypothetical protein QJQ45_024651, partial [Haematococcus lacustris]
YGESTTGCGSVSEEVAAELQRIRSTLTHFAEKYNQAQRAVMRMYNAKLPVPESGISITLDLSTRFTSQTLLWGLWGRVKSGGVAAKAICRVCMTSLRTVALSFLASTMSVKASTFTALTANQPVSGAALLSLQLGWGLWLMPSDYARLGWCANVVLVVLAALTAYSGTLFTRLYQAVPSTVLFSDVGAAAAGRWGRGLVSLIIYSLDATRCVILHLAAAQSLRHVFSPGPDQPPLWQCGAAVLVLAGILVQVRGLAEMSSVFMAGTASQLVAVGIVVWELISHPEPQAHTEWSSQDDPLTSRVAAVVALMNMIFAFGGQVGLCGGHGVKPDLAALTQRFAFTELLGTMRQPAHFPRAILALAQYLINVNVWTHNLLVLLARCQARPGQNLPARACEHCGWRWLVISLFVVAYSCVISVSLPFFSSLVGLVTSVTYLVCAYALPAWFCLRLLPNISWGERLLLWLLIPTALLFSGVGLWGSISALVNDLQGGGEGFGRVL